MHSIDSVRNACNPPTTKYKISINNHLKSFLIKLRHTINPPMAYKIPVTIIDSTIRRLQMQATLTSSSASHNTFDTIYI